LWGYNLYSFWIAIVITSWWLEGVAETLDDVRGW